MRRSALFPAFEADAMIAMIEHEPLGDDSVADLLLLNYKGADFVGHRYGPDSNELRLTLGDRLLLLGLTLGDLARYLEAQPFVFAVFTHDDVRRAAEAANHVTPTRRQTKFE